MPIPFVIDNQQHRMADARNELLAQTADKRLDVATAWFAISGYRLAKEGLHQVGAFRLLLGSEPHAGADWGVRPNRSGRSTDGSPHPNPLPQGEGVNFPHPRPLSRGRGEYKALPRSLSREERGERCGREPVLVPRRQAHHE